MSFNHIIVLFFSILLIFFKFCMSHSCAIGGISCILMFEPLQINLMVWHE